MKNRLTWPSSSSANNWCRSRSPLCSSAFCKSFSGGWFVSVTHTFFFLLSALSSVQFLAEWNQLEGHWTICIPLSFGFGAFPIHLLEKLSQIQTRYIINRLSGLMIRAPGYRSRGPG
jgi:hypothetical protein